MRTIPTIGRVLNCRDLKSMTQTERNAYWEVRDPELMAALRKYATPPFDAPAKSKKLPFQSRMEMTQGDR